MRNFISKIFIACLAIVANVNVQAQCPAITCPANITVNNDAGNCSAVVNYTAPVGTDPCATGSSTFNFTGAVQVFTVPVGVTSVTITALGAQGGSNAMGVVGGQGGQATGTLAVTPGDVLNVYVGGTNGFNGGGAAGIQPCANARGGLGGGASDVRLNSTALAQRIIVAAGGGGAGGNRIDGCGRGSGGGGGGGLFGGGGGAGWPFASTTLPTGGTQVAGGNGGTSTYVTTVACINGTNGGLGIGGNGGCEVSSSQGGNATALAGGVGGGNTGANGQYSANWTGQSGAGGSSYITGLTGASTTSGGRTGNGQVVISYAGAAVTTIQTAGLPSGATFPLGTTTNTYQATNAFGTVTCSFTVTVVDAEAPAITCPGAITINTDAGQCTSTASIGTATGTDNCGVPTITNNAPATFPIGNTTVTWTATDGSGNTTTCTQVVTVVDAEAPVITCPANTTINTDAGQCTSTASIGTATGTDNCGVPTITNNAPASFPIGNTTVTWTATDGASNTTTCTQVVTVVDAELPTIICPANITVGNDPGLCSAVVTYTTPIGSDNCTGVVTALSSGLASGSIFPVGTTTVTYTVTDGSSNVDSCSFTVTVADLISPTAVCQNINAYLDNTGNISITAASVDGGSIDDCLIDTLIVSPMSFTCSEIGANNVTLYVYDTYGNVDSCVAVVTVMDTITPTVSCLNINAYLDNTGNVSITAIDVDGGSTDACGIDSITISPTTFTCSEIGANNVTLIVTDNNGNIDSCTAIVTVMDTLAPTVTCPSDQNVKTDNTCIYEIGDYTSLVTNVLDNCDPNTVTVTQIPSAGTFVTADNIVNSKGQTTVTIIVQDMSGNIDSCDFIVEVECGTDLSIPNVFTPNGDGKNDLWNIAGLEDFPDVTVKVFNRWGDSMFESTAGYTDPWDGTYNGTAAPSATYYYIIVLGSGEEGITGTINIIR